MIGIMQGRLTQPKGRGIQFFPFDNWKNEFVEAKKIGLSEIEFIFDYDSYEENPLWQDLGVKQINEIIAQTRVKINAVCFDYFMRRPFFKKKTHADFCALKKENTMIIKHVLLSMKKIGATLIEIPCVDNSALKNNKEKEFFKEWLLEIINCPEARGIKFGLETNLPPVDFRAYIDSFVKENLGANYDSGNSSGLGYNPYEEVTILREKIFNIHIKDRVYHGSTVPLGTGSADFYGLFKGLKEIEYCGSFILQAARGEDGEEISNILLQKKYVENFLRKE